jgi:serine/threonine protein kinase
MTSPTDDRRRRADRVFEVALDLTPEERVPYLDEACVGDAELRTLVERLLRSADEETGSLGPSGGLPSSLWSKVAKELEGGDGDDGGDSPAGTVIGRYRILHEIGRGGMAVVYLAERADGQFEQKVALKRIKRGVDTDEVLLRFDQERQILALARHPNLAQLLDGGVDDDGRPYFVMEYVEGRPIDRYCDEETLSVSDRLRLFLQVARAVSYAHRNLVVHRDLKPSNILVTDDGPDSEGNVVKLLDFGIAKLLDADATPGATPLTRTWARPMTPVYASPEQIRGEPVTTASDIYQLGLLLYELLSGCYPYKLAERNPGEAVRAICETEPTRPYRPRPG